MINANEYFLFTLVAVNICIYLNAFGKKISKIKIKLNGLF